MGIEGARVEASGSPIPSRTVTALDQGQKPEVAGDDAGEGNRLVVNQGLSGSME
jgi:hypothetical protein